MSSYDHLKQIADAAKANGQKPFSQTAYNNASSTVKNHMDTIANKQGK